MTVTKTTDTTITTPGPHSAHISVCVCVCVCVCAGVRQGRREERWASQSSFLPSLFKLPSSPCSPVKPGALKAGLAMAFNLALIQPSTSLQHDFEPSGERGGQHSASLLPNDTIWDYLIRMMSVLRQTFTIDRIPKTHKKAYFTFQVSVPQNNQPQRNLTTT